MATLDRSAHDGARHSDRKPCLDASRQSKRRGRSITPSASRSFISGLVDRVGSKFVRAVAEALVVHMSNQQ